MLYCIILLYIIHILLYIIYYIIISHTILSSSSDLSSSSSIPIFLFLFLSSLLSFPSSNSFYTCRHLDILIYIPFRSIFSSVLLFYSIPPPPFPSIYLLFYSHSFYTCRCLLLDTYISDSSPYPKTDPACFIGVDG